MPPSGQQPRVGAAGSGRRTATPRASAGAPVRKTPSSARQQAMRGTPPRGKTPKPARKPPSEHGGARAPQRAAAPARPAGLSVRTKIVLSAAAIVIVAGVLSFVVVFFQAQKQLNEEIDKKGAVLVNTLRSVDPELWIEFMRMKSGGVQKGLMDIVAKYAGANWEDKKIDILAEWEGLKTDVDKIRTLGDVAAYGERLKKFIGVVGGNATWYSDAPDERKAEFNKDVGDLAKPFTKIPLETFKEGDANPGVLGISVKPLGTKYAVSIDTYGTSVQKELKPTGGARTFEGVTVVDGHVDDEAARMFKYEQTSVPGGGTLTFYVLLSLEEIQSAKKTLLLTVIVPIALSVVLGVAIAFYIGTRITEPLAYLMRDISAVSSGDLAHNTIPRSKDEIGQLAVTFNGMTSALRVAHQNELEKKAMEHELTIATEIQSNLLPKMIPKPTGLDIGAYYRPSKEVGGDYYDFIMIDENHLGIIVADVSGKGIPGSMVMTKTQTLIRMEADRAANTSPSDTLKHVNRMLARDIRKGMFVTAMYMILDLKTFELNVTSAGHNPLMVYRVDGKVDQVNPSGIALGFDKGTLFDRTIKEEKIALNRGDRFAAYTDGVVEAMNEQKEEFGDERFISLIKKLSKRPSNEFVQVIAQALDEFKGAAEQHDDITLVTVRRS